MNRISFMTAAFGLSILVAAASQSHAAAHSGRAADCKAMTAALLQRADPTARFEAVTWHGDARVMTPGSAASGLIPSHCEVIGSLQHRTGLNDETYAIRFHLRLPADWNGRFFFQGGGGSNGELGDALGRGAAKDKTAIELGYAVVSQDSGHDNATNTDERFNGPLAFGFDPVARANYGHLSLKIVADTAKTLIKAYYGRPARFSYFMGCSKGGQEGMTFAQLYPDVFDGIVASAPGFSLPRAALAEAWDVQAFADLVRVPGQPFDPSRLKDAFTSRELTVVRSAILDACDDGDGLKDGLVGDMYKCSDTKVLEQLSKRLCQTQARGDCISKAQVSALTRVVQGPVNRHGRNLYARWFWPSGIDGDAWRMWKTGTADGGIPALNVVLGGASLSAVFMTPPKAIPGGPVELANYQLGFDFDRDAPGIYAVTSPFTTSAWHDIGSRSPDLSAFRNRGGRLIVPHGESDPVFSLKDTLDWYDEVNALQAGRASDFVRVFPVPGLCHCGGGQATDNFDAFSALVDWVESKKAPESLFAVAGPQMPWPGRERPICAYPKVARYSGTGDIEKASSFDCRL